MESVVARDLHGTQVVFIFRRFTLKMFLPADLRAFRSETTDQTGLEGVPVLAMVQEMQTARSDAS